MVTSFPQTISFISDNTKVELQSVVGTSKNNKVAFGNYKYIKSITFVDYVLPLPLDQINKLLRDGLIKFE